MNAALADRWTVTEPGVVHGMPEDAYHADPVVGGSLSHSGAKTLMPPGCPALFAWQREHGRPDKKAFDLGKAAHQMVLGAGSEIAVIPDDMLATNGAASTKAAKEFIASARARGAVPLVSEDYAQIKEMAAALRAHRRANLLLSAGQPEVSLFWRDGRSGVMLRARLDWLRDRRDPLILVDYKTGDSAEPWTFARAAARYGYPSQHAWYSDGARALELADEVRFCFVVQEKVPPYLVSVVELDRDAVTAGRARNQRAVDLYAECARNDTWPSYSDEVELVSVPRWYSEENNS